MNTPYKESKLQKLWFRYGNATGEKWGKQSKPLCYNICVPCGGRYVSVDCYRTLKVAEQVRDKLAEQNPTENYVIIGNYGNLF